MGIYMQLEVWQLWAGGVLLWYAIAYGVVMVWTWNKQPNVFEPPLPLQRLIYWAFSPVLVPGFLLLLMFRGGEYHGQHKE